MVLLLSMPVNIHSETLKRYFLEYLRYLVYGQLDQDETWAQGVLACDLIFVTSSYKKATFRDLVIVS